MSTVELDGESIEVIKQNEIDQKSGYSFMLKVCYRSIFGRSRKSKIIISAKSKLISLKRPEKADPCSKINIKLEISSNEICYENMFITQLSWNKPCTIILPFKVKTINAEILIIPFKPIFASSTIPALNVLSMLLPLTQPLSFECQDFPITTWLRNSQESEKLEELPLKIDMCGTKSIGILTKNIVKAFFEEIGLEYYFSQSFPGTFLPIEPNYDAILFTPEFGENKYISDVITVSNDFYFLQSVLFEKQGHYYIQFINETFGSFEVSEASIQFLDLKPFNSIYDGSNTVALLYVHRNVNNALTQYKFKNSILKYNPTITVYNHKLYRIGINELPNKMILPYNKEYNPFPSVKIPAPYGDHVLALDFDPNVDQYIMWVEKNSEIIPIPINFKGSTKTILQSIDCDGYALLVMNGRCATAVINEKLDLNMYPYASLLAVPIHHVATEKEGESKKLFVVSYAIVIDGTLHFIRHPRVALFPTKVTPDFSIFDLEGYRRIQLKAVPRSSSATDIVINEEKPKNISEKEYVLFVAILTKL